MDSVFLHLRVNFDFIGHFSEPNCPQFQYEHHSEPRRRRIELKMFRTASKGSFNPLKETLFLVIQQLIWAFQLLLVFSQSRDRGGGA